MTPSPINEYIITDHAAFEMDRRSIPIEIVREVLRKPEQKLLVREGRVVLQSRVMIDGKIYLIRIFVDKDKRPAEVVTVYRTSKIVKYWEEAS